MTFQPPIQAHHLPSNKNVLITIIDPYTICPLYYIQIKIDEIIFDLDILRDDFKKDFALKDSKPWYVSGFIAEGFQNNYSLKKNFKYEDWKYLEDRFPDNAKVSDEVANLFRAPK